MTDHDFFFPLIKVHSLRNVIEVGKEKKKNVATVPEFRVQD